MDWVVIVDVIQDILPLPKPPKQEDLGGQTVGGDDQVKKPATCEEFRAMLQSADLGSETSCYTSSNECYTDIKGIPFYDGLQIDYQWEGGSRGQSSCEKINDTIRCHMPRKTDSDRVDYWILLNGCEEALGYSNGWLEDQSASNQGSEISEPEESRPEAHCCSEIEPEDPVYFRNPKPNGPLFLGFGVRCKEGWDFTPNTCASFDAYVGAERDQLWTSGECCPDEESPDTFLSCEAKLEDQKKSATQIQIRYGECYWELEFQSPYYAPKIPSKGSGDCPSGESMCYGSCCSIGHCKCPPESSYCGCW